MYCYREINELPTNKLSNRSQGNLIIRFKIFQNEQPEILQITSISEIVNAVFRFHCFSLNHIIFQYTFFWPFSFLFFFLRKESTKLLILKLLFRSDFVSTIRHWCIINKCRLLTWHLKKPCCKEQAFCTICTYQYLQQ